MTKKKFVLAANINTNDPFTVEQKLILLVGVDALLRTEEGFRVRTTMEGYSAGDLNHKLLTTLRLADKGISLRSEWNHEETTERFINDDRDNKTP